MLTLDRGDVLLWDLSCNKGVDIESLSASPLLPFFASYFTEIRFELCELSDYFLKKRDSRCMKSLISELFFSGLDKQSCLKWFIQCVIFGKAIKTY